MKKIIFIILIAMLFSCNEDEKINSPIDDNPIPEDSIQSCNFNNFNIEYTYVHTKEGNNKNIDIFENTKYSEVSGYKKHLRFTIIQENTNDTIDNLFAVSIQSACNSTGREFNSENCRFTSRTDFMTTKVYCNDLDIFLLERLTGNELKSYNKDTIIVYEEEKGWYHYFLSNQEIEEEVKPLPNLRISSNEIYAKDDTLKIPLNINFLKNDSTKCEVYGIEVEPHYYDINNSYVILPECDLGGGNYEMKHFVKFEAITNQDTIAKIDSILFFRRNSFNNYDFFIGNILVKKYTNTTYSHPIHGSYSTKDSSIWYDFGMKIIRDTFRPADSPVWYYWPFTISIESSIINRIILKNLIGNTSDIGFQEFHINNFGHYLKPNENYYEMVITDLEFIQNNLVLKYSTAYQDSGTSTFFRRTVDLGDFIVTNSTYLKIELKREK